LLRRLIISRAQVLLSCLEHTAPPVLTNLALQILTTVAAAIYLREPPATRLLQALAALLDRADIVPAAAASYAAEGLGASAVGQPQSHPQGVCEAVGGLRLLGRLAAWGHNDAAIRSHLHSLVPPVQICTCNCAK
jgi:hypothetical protein